MICTTLEHTFSCFSGWWFLGCVAIFGVYASCTWCSSVWNSTLSKTLQEYHRISHSYRQKKKRNARMHTRIRDECNLALRNRTGTVGSVHPGSSDLDRGTDDTDLGHDGKWSLIDVYVLILSMCFQSVCEISIHGLEVIPRDFYDAEVMVLPVWGMFAFLLATGCTCGQSLCDCDSSKRNC